MSILTTRGVIIEVKSGFHQSYHDGQRIQHLFTYNITITNTNDFPIQILRRYWKITDAFGKIVEVEGLGIVGEQPIIMPDSSYEYTSNCNLMSELGSMEGQYVCQHLITEQNFLVDIPKFMLETPGILN